MPATIFFSVGEPSGDLHGANLIGALWERHADLRCVGFGGPKMAAAGCELQADLTELAVMWIFRVLINIHKFLGLLLQADNYFKTERPAAVVLIDYPGFNWWVARRAKARGIPVIYYGTPQLWAWAPWRITKMRRFVDHVLCKLPFEEDWFRQRGCHATYVGHPYFDELAARELDHAFIDSRLSETGPLVTILPGSRNQEVAANLQPLLRAAQHIRQRLPETRFAIAAYQAAQAGVARDIVERSGLDAAVYVNTTPELIESADVCLACSGSVSLELLYHAKPSIIHYRVGRWAYWLQDKLRIARYITLTNLLATDRIERMQGEQYHPDQADAETIPMPEYLVHADHSQSIANLVIEWLTDSQSRTAKVRELSDLRDRYARPGASRRAAEYIVGLMNVETPTVPTRQPLRGRSA